MAVTTVTREEAPAPPTGINVIIVGAGFGGLTTAIECHRHGHTVSIYESFPSLKVLGDIISFGPNAGRIFHRWSNGKISAQMRALSIDLSNYRFKIHKYDTGEVVAHQRNAPPNPEAPNFNGHRGELHKVVFEYARELGIELGDGLKVTGDVVVGSDGVRSRARTLVLGYEAPEDKPKSSGYAVWRAWFSNKDMITDPRTAHFCTGGATFNGWIRLDVHFLFSTIKKGTDCCWVLTHRDDHDVDESWSFPGNLEDVYKVLEGWDPMCRAIVEKPPSLVDWKLVCRDPLPTWVSKGGRICLLGDAAHPFLPTSAQGTTQALEDGVTLAVCLRRAGKGNVRMAVKAYQEIRYERVKAVQKTGETTRDRWHRADWEKVKKDPRSIEFPREDWIFGHDAQKHAEEVYDEVVRQLALVA